MLIFTSGWLDKVDEAIEKLKPDSFKGYTIGIIPTNIWPSIPTDWTTRS